MFNRWLPPQAIQENRLQHIFLIGGCDGNEPQRKYYSQLFKYMPEETLVLTMGCGKFRIFDQGVCVLLRKLAV